MDVARLKQKKLATDFHLSALISITLISITGGYIALHSSYAQVSTYTPPGSIATDCSSDATDALNTFFAGLPDNVIVAFGNNACYQLDGTLTLSNKTGITIEGNGATFQRKTQTAADSTHHDHLVFN